MGNIDESNRMDSNRLVFRRQTVYLHCKTQWNLKDKGMVGNVYDSTRIAGLDGSSYRLLIMIRKTLRKDTTRRISGW